jgi:hypothetical protein
MFSPPRITMSLMRPTMLQKPSSSITAMSPVCIQPALSMASAVLASSPQ